MSIVYVSTGIWMNNMFIVSSDLSAILCVYVSVFDGVPRNKQQIDSKAGSIVGEAKREGKPMIYLEAFWFTIIMFKER